MPRSEEYQSGTDEGVLTRFQRGTTSKGKEYASFLVGAQEYSAWDPETQSIAQGYDGMLVQVQYRQQVGSRYRSAQVLTPLLEPTSQQGGAPVAAPVAPGLEPDVQIRIAALRAATMTVGPVGLDKAYVVTTLAREYEGYLLGQATGETA